MTDVKRIKAVKSNPPVKLIDMIVIAAIAVLIIILSVWALLPRDEGAAVVITVNGNENSYPLNEDRVIELNELTVVISGKEVYVRGARCSDKLCEHTGKISKPNQSIVCLPGGVIIRIEGSSDIQVSSGEESGV